MLNYNQNNINIFENNYIDFIFNKFLIEINSIESSYLLFNNNFLKTNYLYFINTTLYYLTNNIFNINNIKLTLLSINENNNIYKYIYIYLYIFEIIKKYIYFFLYIFYIIILKSLITILPIKYSQYILENINYILFFFNIDEYFNFNNIKEYNFYTLNEFIINKGLYNINLYFSIIITFISIIIIIIFIKKIIIIIIDMIIYNKSIYNYFKNIYKYF